MGSMWEQVFTGTGDGIHLIRVTVRLVTAVILGGLIGFERAYAGKEAGVRTHMLVALGAALFAIVPAESGIQMSDLSRVIQGVAAGIGFLGAGTILKLRGEQLISGLNTAACIWLTAAVGMAVGIGYVWPATLSVLLGWTALAVVPRARRWLTRGKPGPGEGGSAGPPETGR